MAKTVKFKKIFQLEFFSLWTVKLLFVIFGRLTHIDKFSGHESGAFLENFSKKKFLLSYDVTMDDNWNESRGINRWRVGAPRHDIKVNLVGYLF